MQNKITPVICHDRKRHFWTWVWDDSRTEIRWCPKCGSITTWYKGKRSKRDGEYYIRIPKFIKKEKKC